MDRRIRIHALSVIVGEEKSLAVSAAAMSAATAHR